MKIKAVYLSAGHNFFGHHGKPGDGHPEVSVDSVECVAGKGLRGDRFFNHKDDYKGQVTFFSFDVYDAICSTLSIHDKSPAVFRRNILTQGINLNSLIGKRFELQGITFEGSCECSPCYWMDQAFGAGAEEALKGQGGLRCRILSNGTLKVGPAKLVVL